MAESAFLNESFEIALLFSVVRIVIFYFFAISFQRGRAEYPVYKILEKGRENTVSGSFCRVQVSKTGFTKIFKPFGSFACVALFFQSYFFAI